MFVTNEDPRFRFCKALIISNLGKDHDCDTKVSTCFNLKKGAEGVVLKSL